MYAENRSGTKKSTNQFPRDVVSRFINDFVLTHQIPSDFCQSPIYCFLVGLVIKMEESKGPDPRRLSAFLQQESSESDSG